MEKYATITVESDGRILLPVDMRNDWLDESDEFCVAELIRPGCVRLLSPQELDKDALAHLESKGFCVEGEEDSTVVARLHRVSLYPLRGHGRRMKPAKLPKVVPWYLGLQPDGPASPKGQNRSTKVLAYNCERWLIFWGTPEVVSVAQAPLWLSPP
jgi:hypothetical protein